MNELRHIKHTCPPHLIVLLLDELLGLLNAVCRILVACVKHSHLLEILLYTVTWLM